MKGLAIGWPKGTKFSEEHKRNLGLAKMGRTDYKKKENVGYSGLHMWVRKMLGKPDKCELCRNNKLRHRQYHWASKSRKYKRDLTDWLRLCVKCHKAYDRVLETV